MTVRTESTTVAERALVDWEFAPVPVGSHWRELPRDAWRAVTVPHVAEGELEDVRRGGKVVYRTLLRAEAGPGAHQLAFSGVSYRCEVEVNGREVGGHEGAWAPFTLDIGPALRDGDNVITVSVDLPDYDETSPFHFRSVLLGFVPDTVGPFGGLWKEITYRRRPVTHLADVRVDVDQDSAAVEVTWDARICGDGSVELVVEAPDGTMVGREVSGATRGSARVECPGAERWSLASPVLHRARVRLTDASGATTDEVTRTVGFRRIRIDGRQILIDDRPVYLRGALHWGHYPGLRAPSPDREQARAELETLRSLGFNAVKFCLFMAPAHYYELCDELGMLVWQEFPLWLPRDNGAMEQRIREQYPRLVELVSGHPSLTLISLGCELDSTVPTTILDWAYDLVRDEVPHSVVCANSGSGECFGGGADAKSDIYDYHFYADAHELDELMTEFTRDNREPRPWLFGEYNDADTWRTAEDLLSPGQPRPSWLSQDLGVNALRSVHAGFASDQQVYRQAEIIAEEGYGDELDGLQELSHRQAHEVRKLVWELTRTHAAISGYVVTTLRDVPTTTSGLLDDRGELKFDPVEIAQVNGDVVLALRSPLRRRWYRGGDRIRILDPYNLTDGSSHAFGVVLANATGHTGEAHLELSLELAGDVLARERRTVHVPSYGVQHVLDIEWTPRAVGTALTAEARLVATLTAGGRALSVNSWPVFVHPRPMGLGPVLLHDPGGRLDGLAPLLGADLVTGDAELVGALRDGAPAGAALVTTAYSEMIRERTAEQGLRTFVVDDETYFRVEAGPFWRENVKRVHPGTWLTHAVPTPYTGTPFQAVAGDSFVSRREIRRLVGEHTPLLTRYDARTYAVGEYAFEWREGRGRTAWSTLRFSGGTGTQPRSIGDSPLALSVLTAFLGSAR